MDSTWRSIVEDQDDAVVRIDQDLVVTWCNQTYAAITKSAPADLVGRCIDEWAYPANLDLLRQKVRETFSGIKSADHETYRPEPDGSYIWWRWRYRLIRPELDGKLEIICIGQNVTHLRQTEKRAKEAETLVADAIENIGDGFLLIDSEMRFMLMNQRMRDFHPHTVKAAVPGVLISDLVTMALEHGEFGDVDVNPEEFVRNYIRDMTDCRAREQKFADGKWALITHAVTAEGGRVGIWTDITEMKCREVEIRKVNASLEQQAETMRSMVADFSEAKRAAEDASLAKSRFLANMSHELRTPLNAIIGFSEMMSLKLFGPIGAPQYEGYVSDIQRSAEHLLHLLQDVLDMSRLEAGKVPLQLEQISLVELSQDVLMMAPAKDGFQAVIDVAIEGAMSTARGDRLKILQCILNLVSNAIHAIPPDGNVWLHFRRAASGSGTEIEIGDTGPGMTMEEADRILTPFERLEPAGLTGMLANQKSGIGLGVPITKALIELHGGTLSYKTEKGAGTRAILFLPDSIPQPRRAKRS